jgi:hypothetical protein
MRRLYKILSIREDYNVRTLAYSQRLACVALYLYIFPAANYRCGIRCLSLQNNDEQQATGESSVRQFVQICFLRKIWWGEWRRLRCVWVLPAIKACVHYPYLVQHAQRLTQRRDESISVIMYTFTCCIYKLLCSSVLDVVMSLMESRRANTYK